MIEVYTGLLGGGKSYKAIKRSAKYLASGGVLATNIEIILDEAYSYVREKFGWEIDARQVVQLENSYEELRRYYVKAPRGTSGRPTLAIIDEAGIFLNTRDSSHTRGLADWLRLSRKDHTDSIFIAQDFKDIDVSIRRLCLYVWVLRDLGTVALPGMKRRVTSKFIEQCYYASNGKPVSGTRKIVTKDPRVFRLYRTEQMFRAFDRLDQVEVLGRAVVAVEGAGFYRELLARLKRDWLLYGAGAAAAAVGAFYG